MNTAIFFENGGKDKIGFCGSLSHTNHPLKPKGVEQYWIDIKESILAIRACLINAYLIFVIYKAAIDYVNTVEDEENTIERCYAELLCSYEGFKQDSKELKRGNSFNAFNFIFKMKCQLVEKAKELNFLASPIISKAWLMLVNKHINLIHDFVTHNRNRTIWKELWSNTAVPYLLILIDQSFFSERTITKTDTELRIEKNQCSKINIPVITKEIFYSLIIKNKIDYNLEESSLYLASDSHNDLEFIKSVKDKRLCNINEILLYPNITTEKEIQTFIIHSIPDKLNSLFFAGEDYPDRL